MQNLSCVKEFYLHENIEKLIQKSFKFIMPMGFLLEANSLKPFQRGRVVYMYTTQMNSGFRAR